MSQQNVKREPSEELGNVSPPDSDQDSDEFSISSASSPRSVTKHNNKPKARRNNPSKNATGAAMRARKYNTDPAVMSKRYRWHNQLQTLTSALSSRSTRVRNRLESNVTYDEVVHIAAAEIEKLRLEVEALEAKLSAKQALISLGQYRPSKPSHSSSAHSLAHSSSPSPASSPSTGVASMCMDSASPIPQEDEIKPGCVSFWNTLMLSEAACALVSPSLRVLQCTESFARSRFQPISRSALLQANMSVLDFFPPSQTPEVLLMISSLWTFGSVSVDNFVIRDTSSPSSSSSSSSSSSPPSTDSVKLIDFTCFANKDPSGEHKVNSIVFIIRKQHIAGAYGSSSSSLLVPATASSAWKTPAQQQQYTTGTNSSSSSSSVFQGTSTATPSSTTPAYSTHTLGMSSTISDKSSSNSASAFSVPSTCSTPSAALSLTSPPLTLPLAACKLPQSLSLLDLLSQNPQPKLTQFSASITSSVATPQAASSGVSHPPIMYNPFLSTSLSTYAAAAVSGSDAVSLYQQMKNANDTLRGRVFF